MPYEVSIKHKDDYTTVSVVENENDTFGAFAEAACNPNVVYFTACDVETRAPFIRVNFPEAWDRAPLFAYPNVDGLSPSDEYEASLAPAEFVAAVPGSTYVPDTVKDAATLAISGGALMVEPGSLTDGADDLPATFGDDPDNLSNSDIGNKAATAVGEGDKSQGSTEPNKTTTKKR